MTEITASALSTTVFTQESLASSVLATQFDSLASLAAALRAVSDPQPFPGLQGPGATVVGVSPEAPGLLSQPTFIGAGNIVALAQQQTGLDLNAFFEPPPFDPLQEGLFIRPPPFNNFAREAIEASLIQAMARAQAETVEDAGLAEIPGPAFTFPSILQRPSENAAFGAAFSSVPLDPSQNSVFFNRIGVPSGGAITLADIQQRASTGAATNFAVSLTGAFGDAPGGALSLGGTALAENSIIAASDLANVTYTPPRVGIGLDNISLIELRDDGADGSFDARGVFQTVALTFAGAAQFRRDGDERIRDFFFGAEDRTVQTQVVVAVSGVNSLGFTNALDAINAGNLRIRGLENRSDGSINRAVTNLYESSANSIVLRFPFLPTQNGASGSNIQVEVRSLDLNFDISTISLFAILG